jgi:hypothetical protein
MRIDGCEFLSNAYPANLLPTNCFIFCVLKHRRGEVSGTWEAMGLFSVDTFYALPHRVNLAFAAQAFHNWA